MNSVLSIGLLISFMASCILWVGHGQNTFDVLQYGATGDGLTDDSTAFMKAWEAFCGASEDAPILTVPAGYTFLLYQSTIFKGPCQSSTPHIQVLGTILAPPRDAWKTCSDTWLNIREVTNLIIDGSGKFDGQGQTWWKKRSLKSCQAKEQRQFVPTALIFYHCDGLQVRGLTHVNGPGPHIKVTHSKDVILSNLTIISPGDSPNTDGINIGSSTGVHIHSSVIGTGDDCIAIKGGSYFINITQVRCGPGHGISMGSLGYKEQEDEIENIQVLNCQFNGTTSAARIKTWPGGKGYARTISFKNITINQTKNPIFIDQHYQHKPEQPQAVKVSNVTFSDIRGTCLNERAIILDCANIGCTDIKLKDISITSINPKKPASAICNHVYGTSQDTLPAVSCLINQ